ncbi:MAG: hypothetical protein IJY25_02150 [Bacilli bacterium]|nr:hypothetical protein [Bacilli bacterium]
MKKSVVRKIISLISILLVIGFAAYFVINFLGKEKKEDKPVKNYVSSELTTVSLYDLEYKEVTSIVRGSEVKAYKYKEKVEDTIYVKVKHEDEIYLIKEDNLTENKEEIIKEKELYVRTSTTIYKDIDSSKIESFVKKGEKVEILGYDKLDEEGKVNRYKIKYNDIEGYVYGKYLVSTLDESLKVYDENGIQEYMDKMGSSLGGGDANNLDYYPYEKPKFENNVMPEEVRSLYINSAAVKDIDEYIEFAKENNINAFVIDIKDNTSPAYDSPVMQEYSPTNYEKTLNNYEDYKTYVKKAKDAGIYLIGRITTFKDSYFVNDHKEVAIKSSNGEPFSHNGSYWPSAYNRFVWEFNVELAKEAVTEIGFNEIQFDYVRFPDRTTKLENSGTIDLGNNYDEEKAGALQAFVMYACDEIHNVGAYVSIDVFGESANNYVTAYGQFW